MFLVQALARRGPYFEPRIGLLVGIFGRKKCAKLAYRYVTFGGPAGEDAYEYVRILKY